MTTRSHQSMVVVGCAFAALACGSTTIDSGSGAGGASGSTSTGGTGGTPTPGFLGEWKGYVENHEFDDGTNTLTLTLDSLTPEVIGHVRFGDAPLLPAPTNPDVGYPPAFENSSGPGPDVVVSGFWYTLKNASFDGKRLKFQAMTGELWNDWCGFQTPIYDETFAKYFCAHPWGMSAGGPSGCTQKDPTTGETLDVNCSKLNLCNPMGMCVCDAQSCLPRTTELGGPTMDIQLVPPDADGDVGGLGGNVHAVHLKKQ